MKAKNKVIAGEYEGKTVLNINGTKPAISVKFAEYYFLDNDTVESYEVMDSSTSKSTASAVGRGLLGGMLLGPVGLLAAASAKTKGIFVIAIQFKDGKKSLIEVDEKIHKTIMTKCFK